MNAMASPSPPSPPPSDLSHPLDPNMTVRQGLADYLAENGFDVREYTAPTFRLKVLGRYFDVPNTRDRQWAIPLHDLHHVATGYGTDFAGEAEIAAWELSGGCRTWVVYYLNLTALSLGLAIAPRRVLEALRAARSARALYRQPLGYEEALALTIGELRERLGVPREGLATRGRRLHTDAQERWSGESRVAEAYCPYAERPSTEVRAS